MDELLSQFLIEGRDLIADAQAALSTLRDDPSNAAQIDRAFRAVHTLKGSVAIFAMAPAERVLHAAEDLLQRARAANTALTADEIGRLVATIDQDDSKALAVGEAFRGVQTREARADDDRDPGLGHKRSEAQKIRKSKDQ